MNPRIVAGPFSTLESGVQLWIDRLLFRSRPRHVLPIPDGHFVHHAASRFEVFHLNRGAGQVGRGLYTWTKFEPAPSQKTRFRLEIALTPRDLSMLATLLIPLKTSAEYVRLFRLYTLATLSQPDLDSAMNQVDASLAKVDLVLAPVAYRWHGLTQAVFKPTGTCSQVLRRATLTWQEYNRHEHAKRAREVEETRS
ncbi:MAG: hypothetical protein K6V73_06355 [Firmicutes bacterium]|nr:hypothetical protein [Bacillota bacterium]